MILAEINRLPDHDDGGERTNVQRVQTVLNEAVVRVQNELFDLGLNWPAPRNAARIHGAAVPRSNGRVDGGDGRLACGVA